MLLLSLKNFSHADDFFVTTKAKGDWGFWISHLVKNPDGTDI